MQNKITLVADLDDKVTSKQKRMFEDFGKNAKATSRDLKDLTGAAGSQFGQMGQTVDAAASTISKFGIAGGSAIIGVGAAIAGASIAWNVFGDSAIKQSPMLAASVGLVKTEFEQLKESIALRLVPVFNFMAEVISGFLPGLNKVTKASDTALKALAQAETNLRVEMIKTNGLEEELTLKSQGKLKEAAQVKLSTAIAVERELATGSKAETQKLFNDLAVMNGVHLERVRQIKAKHSGDIANQLGAESINQRKELNEEFIRYQSQIAEKKAIFDAAKLNDKTMAQKAAQENIALEFAVTDAETQEYEKRVAANQKSRDAKFEMAKEQWDKDKQLADVRENYRKAAAAEDANLLKKALDDSNRRDAAEIQSARQVAQEKARLRSMEIQGMQMVGGTFGALAALMATSEKKSREMRMMMRTLLMAQTAMNTAAAIMNVWAQPGVPYWLALGQSIAVGITGAAQMATISQQKMAEGGSINGPSHAGGGVNINAEGGEFMMRRSAVDRIGLNNLERMNNGGSAGMNFSPVIHISVGAGMSPADVESAVRRGLASAASLLDRTSRHGRMIGALT